MALVVAAANGFHLFYILFPELGALVSDVLLRPGGKWAREPWKLVCTPVIGGAIGIVICRYMPYGVVSILTATVLCIGVVFDLKSAVAPAISAGVLPIVLGVTSWLYPACILGSLLILTGILLIWKRIPPGLLLMPIRDPDAKAIDVLESRPKGWRWLVALLLFVGVLGLAAQLSGWRFILFPPLIVMAYEMLGHPETCPWAKQPYTFPVVCTATAFVGLEADVGLGVTPWAAALVVVFGCIALRIVRLRMPPAIAIGLIPFVLTTPSLKYPISVAIGTCALTLWFLLFRFLVPKPGSTTEQ